MTLQATRLGLMVVTVLVMLVVATRHAGALDPTFTYQGQLQQNGSPVNGTCDFQFSLWDAPGSGSPPVGGIPIGTTQLAANQLVTDGLFSLPVSFGSDAFDGANRWLHINLRCPGGSGNYTALTPRQQLTAAPYAVYAPSAGSASDVDCTNCVNSSDLANGAVTSSKIAAGTIEAGNLAFVPGTVTSVIAGEGLTGGLITGSGTIAANLGTTPGTVAAGDHTHEDRYWSLYGNANTAGGFKFLGTTDNVPLEIRVNNQGALRLEPGISPNVIGGWSGNVVPAVGIVGSVIAGGGTPNDGSGNPAPNLVADNYCVVGGGIFNQAGRSGQTTTDGAFATVGGGSNNTANAYAATVGGGVGNTIFGDYATVAGGRQNLASVEYATVAGGWGNRAEAAFATIGGGGRQDLNDPNTANRVTDNYGTVAGGENNVAGNANPDPVDAFAATVGGGGGNIAGGQGATVAGGGGNQATALYASVGGGAFNFATADYATVPGGAGNAATAAGSLAAGRLAFATHAGSFVWGDGSRIAGSISANSFNALATGGFHFYFDAIGNHCDLTSTGGWSCFGASDRNSKTNVTQVDGREILTRLATVPVQTWSYKAQDGSVRHIGPMAQDFYTAFNVGEDATHINTIDTDGVALAAIQGLHQLVQEKDAAIAALEARVTALERAIQRSSGGGR